MDLANLLDSLGPASSGAYAARVIPGSELHFVARDTEGFPLVMLGSRDAPHGLTPPLRLQAFEAQFAVLCEVALPDGRTGAHKLSVVRCLSADPELQRYFLRVCEAVLQLVGGAPAFTQVTGALRRMVALFQRLSQAPTREIVGLYGELLIISWCKDPVAAIAAWRADPNARFDFSIDDARLEVKTTTHRNRAHSFSLDQCRPPPGTVGLVASVLAEPGAGASLGEVIERIESRAGGDVAAVMKLQELVSESLGASLVEGLKARYDDRAARSSARWFFCEDIPSPQGEIPPSVTELRFKVDLSATKERLLSDLLDRAPSAEPLLAP